MKMSNSKSWLFHGLIAQIVFWATFLFFKSIAFSAFTAFVCLLTIEGTQIEAMIETWKDFYLIIKQEIKVFDRWMDVCMPMTGVGIVIILLIVKGIGYG